MVLLGRSDGPFEITVVAFLRLSRLGPQLGQDFLADHLDRGHRVGRHHLDGNEVCVAWFNDDAGFGGN